ncbi:putative RNA helicase armi [Glossina fuscipes fuscipes]
MADYFHFRKYEKYKRPMFNNLQLPNEKFEVREPFKQAFITEGYQKDMLENMFPSLTEELNINNYTIRFGTLLHLEEMEWLGNIRKHNRERGHFTRKGRYYLPLTIENEKLSECRPSLVIGDIIKAKDPWTDSENAEHTYEGVIHKGLFNRILLKFDANFQQKYNGENYHLEFYFSRYGYREQHHAVLRAIKNLGEQFLFPSGARTRGCPQLNIHFDEHRDQTIEEDSREAEILTQLDDLLPQSRTQAKTHGISFRGIRSEDMQEEDSPSWCNFYEAKQVFLMTVKLYRKNIKSESIGIITPYEKQVKRLRKLFDDADVAMAKIGIVEDSQGQEREIILISTVRSSKELIPSDVRHGLGFNKNKALTNLAISRSRYFLYVYRTYSFWILIGT